MTFKRFLSFVLAMAMIIGLLPPLDTSAAEITSGVCGSDLSWVLTDDGTLTISGTGAMNISATSSGTVWGRTYSDQITSVVIEEGVTTISDSAFMNCDKLESVSLPGSLTTIGNNAFLDATSLETIDVDSSNTAFCTDEQGVLYSYDMSTLVKAPTTLEGAYEIPATVTALCADAFGGAAALTSVVIPGGVTQIPSYAFSGCEELTDVYVPTTVTSVASCAFYNCTGLYALVFAGDAPEFAGDAFSGSTVVAYYPAGNVTWTDEVLVDHGGSVTWIAFGDEAETPEMETPEVEIPEVEIPEVETPDVPMLSLDTMTAVEITEEGQRGWLQFTPEQTDLYGFFIPGNFSVDCYLYDSEGEELAYVQFDAMGHMCLAYELEAGKTYYFEPGFTYKEETGTIQVMLAQMHAFVEGCCTYCDQVLDFSGTCGDELTWTLDGIGTLTISGSGDMYNYMSDAWAPEDALGQEPATAFAECAPWYPYYNVITEVVVEDGVTSVGYGAFYGLSNLMSVSLGADIATIGQMAFGGCTCLESVQLPDGVSAIGAGAFMMCTTLSEIDLPENLNAIGMMAFAMCESLCEITIPDSVHYIGAGAFMMCSMLEAVDLPANLTAINEGLFMNCGSLHDITIPESVTSIGAQAFYYCESLTEINIPASVTTIGNAAFASCYGLTEIDIPDSVTYIGYAAFYECESLTEVVLPAGLIEISSELFANCYNLTGITIPASVTYIDSYAFEGCYNLSRINFEGDAPIFGSNVFSEVFANAYYPAENETWTSGAKQSCGFNLIWYAVTADGEEIMDEIPTLTLGEPTMVEVTSDDDSLRFMFVPEFTEKFVIYSTGTDDPYCYVYDSNGNELENDDDGSSSYHQFYIELTLEEGETYYFHIGFYGTDYRTCDVMLEIIHEYEDGVCVNCGEEMILTGTCGDDMTWELVDGVLTISGTGAMYDYDPSTAPWYDYRDLITSVVVEDGVTSISDYAFYECTVMTEAALPAGLTEISSGMFKSCYSLTDVTIPETVTFIGSEAFWDCDSLTEVTISDSVTEIGENAFIGCEELAQVEISASVTYIGYGAFQYCYNLTRIDFAGDAPEFGYDVFSGVSANAYYPADNTTWTSSVKQSCGINLTWYAVTAEGEEIMDEIPTITPGELTTVEILVEGGYPRFMFVPETTERYAFYSIANGYDTRGYLYDSNGNCLDNDDDGKGNLQFLIQYTLEAGEVYYFVPRFYSDYDTGTFDVMLEIIHEYGEDGCIHCGEQLYFEGTCGDDLTWTLAGDGVLTISGTGAMYDFDMAPWYDYRDNITSIVVEDGVTYIGSYAFEELEKAEEASLSGDVTAIGAFAFSRCWSLTEIVLPESLTYIGEYAFQSCSGLTEITIPASVTYIGERAFQYCESLTEVVLPESLTYIGNGTFHQCSNLTQIEIPASVTEIGAYAFQSCYDLQQIEIPASVTYIGQQAFAYCNSLSQIVFAGEAPQFDNDVFYNVYADAYFYVDNTSWNSLVRQNIGGDLTWHALDSDGNEVDIPADVFGGTCGENLTWELVDGVLTISGTGAMDSYYSYGNYDSSFEDSSYYDAYYAPWYDYRDMITAIVIEDGVTTIGRGAFRELHNVISATVGSDVATIGSRAFYDCDALQQLTLPEDLTHIGYYAFCACYALGEISLPNSLTHIGANAFYNITSLAQITIPASVAVIGNEAFAYCTALTQITFAGEAPSLGSNVFYNVTADAYFYADCTTWNSYARQNFGGSLTWHALNSDGEEVEIPADVLPVLVPGTQERVTIYTGGQRMRFEFVPETTDVYVFYSLSNTDTHCYLYDSEGNQLAYDDSSGENGDFRISYTLTAGEVYYFEPGYWDSSRTGSFNVMLKAVHYYEDGICTSCGQELYVTGTCGDGLTWELDITGTLTISGTGAMNDYDFGTAPWYDYVEYITGLVVEDGVTSIGKYAFSNIHNLTTATIADSVTSVGNDAFYNCESLTTVTLSTGLTAISNGMFRYCYDLSEITIPDGVTSIGNNAFYYCESLTTVTLPTGLTTIGYGAFQECRNLTEITIPNSVTSIGENAFYYCDKLAQITIPESVSTIGNYAFSNCYNLTRIEFTGDVPAFDNQVFYNVTANAYYPADNTTWIAEVKQGYGGNLTWYAVTAEGEEIQDELPVLALDSQTTVQITVAGGRIRFQFVPEVTDNYRLRIPAADYANCYLYDSYGNQLAYNANHGAYDISVDATLTAGNTYYFECGFHDSSITGSYNVVLEARHNYSGGYCTYCGAEMYITGSCGDGLTWVLDSTCTLTISGEGAMYNYYSNGYYDGNFEDGSNTGTRAPWYEYQHLITAIVIEDGVTSVGTGAFWELYNVTAVTMGSDVATIGTYAFYNCYNMQQIILSESLTHIARYAFHSCNRLEEIYLPASVEYIGDHAFDYCNNLTRIEFAGDAPTFGSAYIFYGVKANAYYPADNTTWTADVKQSYNGFLLWYAITAEGEEIQDELPTFTLDTQTAVQITVEGGKIRFQFVPQTTDIYALSAVYNEADGYFNIYGALYDSEGNQLISSNNGNSYFRFEYLMTAGEVYYYEIGYADESRTGTFHMMLECIHSYAGDYCTNCGLGLDVSGACGDNLTWSLDSTGILVISGTGAMYNYYSNGYYDSAFETDNSYITEYAPWYDYRNLITAVVIEDSVTSIGRGAFKSLYNVTSVTLGANVATIGSYAFYDCDKLTEISLPESLTHIGAYAFRDSSALNRIVFTGNAPAIANNAFYNVRATAICPAGNETWTAAYMRRYGGFVTWVFRDENGVETVFSNLIPGTQTTVEITTSGDYPLLQFVPEFTDLYIFYSISSYDTYATLYDSEGNRLTSNDDYSGRNFRIAYVLEAGKTYYFEPRFYGSSGTGTYDVMLERTHEYVNGVCEHCGEALMISGTFGDGLTWTISGNYVLTISGEGAMPNYYTSSYDDTFEDSAYIEGLAPWYEYQNQITAIVIEDGITSVGRYAFSELYYATSVTLSGTVTTIGSYAFYNCNNLRQITLPESLTHIGQYAFYDCNLQQITLPASLLHIGNYAFGSCSNLDRIVFSGDVPEIAFNAFSSVYGTALYPAGNETWTEATKLNYSGLLIWKSLDENGVETDDAPSLTLGTEAAVQITTAGNRPMFKFVPEVTEQYLFAVYGDYSTTMGLYDASGNYVSPASGDTINGQLLYEYALQAGQTYYLVVGFSYSSYTGTINALVKLAHNYQNGYCTYCNEELYITGTCGDLNWVIDSDGTLTISGNGAIPNYAGSGYCDSTFEDSANTADYAPWYYYRNLITAIVIEEGVTSVGRTAFRYLYYVTEVTMGNTVTTIGSHAFYDCSNLTHITLSEGLTHIGHYAFGSCYSLTEISLPASLVYVSNYGFSGSSLTRIVFNGDAPQMMAYAFGSRNAVVVYPAGNETWTTAVRHCYGGFLIWMARDEAGNETEATPVLTPDTQTTVETLIAEARPIFKFVPEVTDIYVIHSIGSIRTYCALYDSNGYQLTYNNAYGTTDGQFRIEYELTAGETYYFTPYFYGSNGPGTFDILLKVGHNFVDGYCTYCGQWMEITGTCGENLTWTLDATGTLTISGEGAMPNYGSYSAVDTAFEDSADNTNTSAPWYEYQDLITAIVIEDGVTSVGRGAFHDLYNVTSVTLGANVVTIGSFAFDNCYNLTNITLSEGLTHIGNYVFSNCTNLQQITLPASLTHIGQGAFEYCSALKRIVFAGDAPEIVNNAFSSVCGTALYPAGNETWTAENKLFYGGVLFWFSLDENGVETDDAAILTPDTQFTVNVPVAEYRPLFKFVPEQTDIYAIYSIANADTWCGLYDANGYQIAANDDGGGNLQFRIQYLLEAGKTYYFEIRYLHNGSTGSFDTVFEQLHNYVNGYCEHCGLELRIEGTCGELSWLLDSTGTLTVSGEGAMPNYYGPGYGVDVTFEDSADTSEEAYAPWYEYRSLITSVVIEDGVTDLGRFAFIDHANITSVTLGNSVATIGSYAFRDCPALTQISFGNGLTHIGREVFVRDYALAEVTLPDSVVHVGESAFYECTGLTSITLSAGLTELNHHMLYGCTSLAQIVIPDSVTTIGNNVFYNCSSLVEVAIPSGVTSIGYQAFAYCTGLVSVQIADSVTDFYDYVFQNCTSLESITLPAGLTEISYGMLYNCTGLTEVVIPSGVTTIGGMAFYNCESLTKITISSGVTTIGSYAFYNCDSLTEIVIPNSVTVIGDYVFESCDNLESVTLSTGLTEISHSMFSGCAKLTQVEIPEGVTYIDHYAFTGCTSLTEIVIPEGVTYIGEYAFSGCTSLESITLPEGLTQISNRMFNNCTSLTQIAIPNSVTYIYDYAFQNCTSLTEMVIPDGVTSIGYGVFQDCTGLVDVQIADSVTTIGSYAFQNCTSLESITLPAGLTQISYSMFNGCTNLAEITIPDSVTYIGAYAFYNCTSLTQVRIPDGVTYISANTFNNCTSLAQVHIPRSVTTIYDYAFYNCTALESVLIPGSVTTIYGYAFQNCTSLKQITLAPIAVPSLNYYSFYNCTALETIYVPAISYDAYVEALSGIVSSSVEIVPVVELSVLEDLHADLISSHSVVLSWNELPGIAVSYYDVYRDGEHIGTTTDCSFVDRTLESGVTYTYTVQAICENGSMSAATPIEITTVLPQILDIATDYPGNFLDDVYYNVYITTGGLLGDLDDAQTILQLYVELEEGRVLVGQTTCQAGVNGYSFYVDLSTLEDGQYQFTAVLTDVDGAYTQYSENITIDRTLPAKISYASAYGDVRYIYISWAISVEVDTDTYRIYRRVLGEDAFELLAEIDGRNTLTYTDSTAQLGTVYEYYVVGVDSLGREGEASDITQANREADVTPPTVTRLYPSSGTYLAGTVTFYITAEDDLEVTGTALYYSLDNGETWTLVNQQDGKNSCTVDTTAFADGAIRFKGVAYDESGNVSSGLVYAYVIDNTGPEQVQNLRYEATNVTVTLRWDDVADDDISYFCVEQKNADGSYSFYANIRGTLGTNIYGLSPDTEYTYRVVGYDTQGNRGIPSEDITVSTVSDTTNPVITTLRPNAGYYSNTITLSATATDEFCVSAITLQISLDLVNWVNVYTQQYSDVSTRRTLSYQLSLADYDEGAIYFRAIATDAAGNRSDSGVNSAYIQYIIDRQAPAAPENLAANGGNGHILISWAQGSENDLSTYSLYRADAEDGEYILIASGLRTLSYYDRSAQDGVTYYYKLAVCDVAGNVSEMTAPVSAMVAEDTEAPTVLSFYPISETLVGTGNNNISISASDNRSLAWIVIEYSLDGTDYQTLHRLDAITSYGQYASTALPIEGLDDGAVIYVRAKACDNAGNESEYLYAQYTVDNTAPQIGSADVAFDAENNQVTINWTGFGEEDLVRYNIYRKTGNGSFGLINYVYAAEGQTAYTYTDSYLSDQAVTYTYQIVATDRCGNTYTVETTSVKLTDRTAPRPYINADATMEVGVEYLFDGTSSSDDSGIVQYRWDFGDGSTGTGSSVIHVYGEVGTYEVSLTVVDDNGNQSTTYRTVTVRERSQLGVITIRVVDENGSVVPGASVYFNLGEEDQVIKVTDGNGCATFTSGVGVHTVGCFISNNEWLPASKEVVVTAGAQSTSTITMIHQTLIEGQFEINRMTFEEIVAAGIDVSAPENQHIVRINVSLIYTNEPEPVESSFLFNMSTGTSMGGHIIYGGGGGSSSSGGGGGGGRGGSGQRELIPTVFYSGETDSDLVIAYLDIPIGASFLKEFFDVKLHILNHASSEFTMINNVVTLNLPEGLTLMETNCSSSTETVVIDEIKGQSSETINWIIRGDTQGSYNLSADYTGTLAVFNENVSTKFVSQEPLVVYGLSAIKLVMEVNPTIYYDAFYFNITMTNTSDIDIYMPSLEVIGNTISAFLDYADPDKTDVYSTPEVHLLNTLLTNASGYRQYIGTETTVTTLAPGESITEKYAVYNTTSYNGTLWLKQAAYTIEEGMGVDFQIIEMAMDLYSTVNAMEKVEDIRKNYDKQAMLNFIMGNYNYFYISESLERDSDLGTLLGEQMYGFGQAIFSFDFDYNAEETREITRKMIAQMLMDESVQEAMQANIETKYLDVTEKVLKTISGFLPDEDSKSLLEEYADNSNNMAELAKVMEIEGLDGVYGRLGNVVGSTIISGVITTYSSQLDDAFSGALGEACSKIGDVVEAAGKVVTAWNDAAEMTAALMTIAAAQEEARDLLDMLEAYVDKSSPVYDEVVAVREALDDAQNEMRDQFLQEIGEEAVGALAEKGATTLLVACFGSGAGTIYAMLKIAFGTLDYVFDWSGTIEDLHTLRVSTSLSFALRSAFYEYGLYPETHEQALYTLKALKYTIKMRLIGESGYIEMGKTADDSDEYLQDVRDGTGVNYKDLDAYGSDIFAKVLSYRDQLFATYYTELDVPDAPEVSINYLTGTTNESFSSDYEYSFDGENWYDCDGGPITLTPAKVGTTLRVRVRSSATTLAGNLATVVVPAMPVLFGDIHVVYVGDAHRISGLPVGTYIYEFTNDDTLQTLTGTLTVEDDQTIVLPESGVWTYMAIRSVATETAFASQIRYLVTEEKDVTEIIISDEAATLYENDQVQLSVQVLPDDALNRTVTWHSSNPEIATVDENGLVTAVTSGSVIITATSNDGTNITVQCVITVMHNYVSVVTDPTCTEQGYTTHTCDRCADSYVDSYVDALGHSHEAVVTAPTCTEQGYTTHTCHCGDSYVDTYVDALGHSYGEWYVTTAPTCTEIGQERHDCERCDHYETREIPALGHTLVYTDAQAPTCTEIGWNAYETCTVCGYTTYAEIAALGHDEISHEAQAPTCTEIGWEAYVTCSRCDYTTYVELVALGHTVINHEAKAPTCTEIGWNAYETCAVCDYTTYVELPALGHTLVYTEAKAPTCTEIGWEAYETCQVCDHTTYVELPALGHDEISHEAKAPTCTEIGWEAYVTCSRCDYTTYVELAALGHTVITHEAKAPTCTEIGWEAYETCAVCDHTTYAEIAALGHDEINHEAQAPTCTEIGWEAYVTCSRCDHTTYEEIPATGHSHEAVVTDPTCTEQGYTTHTCHCGDSYVDSYVDALGHSYEATVTAPTCTDEGYTTHTCSRCGDSYVDSITAALGHSYEAVVTDPTCTEQGYTTYTCTACGEDYVDDYVDALGHDEISHEAKAPTCTEIGWDAYVTCSRCDYTTYVEIEATGHTEVVDAAVAPTCTETGLTEGKHCSVCNEVLVAQTVVAALGHTEVIDAAVAPNCTETGLTEGKHCSVCGEVLVAQEVVNATGHSHEATVTAPTCTEQGYTTHTCHCGDTYVDSITAALGHSYEAVVTDPTCTAQGYTTYTCSVCGDTYKADYVDALGHDLVYTDAKAPTCTEIGWNAYETCKRCDHTTYAQINATGHSYESVVTAPTCTEAGYTTHTCTACGDSYVDSTVNALGHIYGAWQVITAATCTTEGQERHDCDRCDHHETQVIKATGHSYTSVVTAPTCTADGYTTHTCTACGHSYVDSTVAATGHSFSDWKVVIAATCTTDGQERRDCACGHYETRVITATGHSLVHHEAQAATCTQDGWKAYDTCANCDYSTYVKLDALGHSYTSVVTAPTCTEKGFTTHTCTTCGDSYVDSFVDVAGHNYESVVTAPTCTERGYTTHTCTACGASYVDNQVEATGHHYGDWYTSKPSTGTEHGEQRRDCACGHYESQALPLLGDVNGDGKVTSTDARLIAQYELGMIDDKKLNLAYADVNGDGKINTEDAKLVMQLEIGLITKYTP